MTANNLAVPALVLTGFCFTLAACSGGGGTQSQEPSFSTEEPGSVAVDNTQPELGAAIADTATAEQPTFFASSATAGFTGNILDDGSVALDWTDEPGARGYNVYRAGEYIDTVFDTSYRDENLDAGGYYYEVIAFDNNDQFELVADALTVYIDVPSANEATAAGTLPTHIAADYQMVFAEEFDTTTLDFERWNSAYLWGKDLVINSEEQYYVDVENEPDFGYNPFKLNGETLTIEAIRTPDELRDKANGQPYLSGVLTSYDSFQFTYGYVEARAKLPYGKGFWSAFWLLNAFYVDLRPEIDIMEHIADDRDVVFHTYHYYDAAGELRSTESMETAGVDFSSEFHTYGVEWRPGTLIFYVDGVEQRRVSDPNVSAQDMYIILNTAVGGWWPGSPDESTEFPSRYEIDYVRAYQRIGVQLDAPVFNDNHEPIPLDTEVIFRAPNHIPSPEQWPQAWPGL